MPTDAPSPPIVQSPLTLKELAALLVKHYGLTEGKFDLLVEYQFAAGQFGPTPDSVLPAMMVSISKLGLMPSPKDGPLTIDAAAVNASITTKRARKPAAK